MEVVLPAPFGPSEPEDAVALHREVHVFERDEIAVPLREGLCLHQSIGHLSLPPGYLELEHLRGERGVIRAHDPNQHLAVPSYMA